VVAICTIRFNSKNCDFLATQCINVFRVNLVINSEYFLGLLELISFYNRGGMCSPRGTNCVNILRFIFVYKALVYVVWHLQDSELELKYHPSGDADQRLRNSPLFV